MKTAPLLAPLCLGLLLAVPSTLTAQAARARPNPSALTADELHEPAVAGLSLYDAIRRLRPNWLRARGSNSFGASRSAATLPGVIVDDAPQIDVEILRSIKASDATGALFMSASDATTRYGTGYSQGAILITTLRR